MVTAAPGQALLAVSLVGLAVALVLALFNQARLRRFDDYRAPAHLPRVSILLPARNEEANLAACLRMLLGQDYPDYEVLVLDDHSTDGTRAIADRLAEADPRLRVLAGAPLPGGWLGKHWACHQLAGAATGEFLLFVDADTRHVPAMLRDSVAALLAEEADLLTAWPREEALTWGERLVIPVIAVGLACLPAAIVERFRLAAFSVTIGQFMLFRRPVFEAIGGYAAVRAEVADDVELGRRAIRAGFHWRLMDGTRHVSCRMYGGFRAAAAGIGKVLPPMFGHRILPYVAAMAACAVLFLWPVATLALTLVTDGSLVGSVGLLAAAGTALTASLWTVAYRRAGHPCAWVVTYPVVVVLLLAIAGWAAFQSRRGRASWRDRPLPVPAWRWW